MIERISSIQPGTGGDIAQGNVIVMVGSFAPIHEGHMDALISAKRAISLGAPPANTLVITPNSAEYVARKLGDEGEVWTYERRIEAIISLLGKSQELIYVDDISGPLAGEEQINDYIPLTIEERLGALSCQLFFVVGSDQLPSMEQHLSQKGRSICVVRPGRDNILKSCLRMSWAKEALMEKRLIITPRANMTQDISSTDIRELR